MRNAIREYIELSEQEKNELWNTGTFIFDTNVFLNLYRYSKKTREVLFKAMGQYSDRIWMPHQVAMEFMRRRTGVLFEANERYDMLKTQVCGELYKNLKESLRVTEQDSDFTKLKKFIEHWIDEHKSHNVIVTSCSDDCILSDLLTLFDGKTGVPYDPKKLDEIKCEGKKRYEAKIPPGYMDNKKAKDSSDNNAYGDLIVWKQILDFAKNSGKSIVFVTHDQKDDWWEKNRGKILGPRYELRKEFLDATDGKQSFHMYSMDGFISHFDSVSPQKIDDSVLDEVKSYNSSNPKMIDLFSGIGGDITSRYLDYLSSVPSPYRSLEDLYLEYNELEELNNRRREDLAGILRNFGTARKPVKVKEMEQNLRRKIREDEKKMDGLLQEIYDINYSIK